MIRLATPFLILTLAAGMAAQATSRPTMKREPARQNSRAPVPKTALGEKLKAIAARTKINVAHRGNSGSLPENTIPAFASAVAQGADMVELDFYQTKDDILVCFHDKTLDRTTDCVARWQREKRRRRVVMLIGVVVFAAVVGVIVGGVFATMEGPPQKLLSTVNGTSIERSDYVEMLRISSSSSTPEIVLGNLESNELLRQGAVNFGIIVTD